MTQAVRAAGKEKSVLLFFDECLRWREDTQAFLLTFLTGIKKDGALHYKLTTKKSVGGVLETITCKAKHLHIICGANLTAESPVRAFWSRFRKHRIDFSESMAKAICKSILKTYGVEESDKISAGRLEVFSDAFARAMSESRDQVKKGALFESWDFRCLEQAITTAGADLFQIVKELGKITPDHCDAWDMDNGDTSKDSNAASQKIFDNFAKIEGSLV